jgi:hypothetical protein
MSKFKIEYTGKTMDQFPPNSYFNVPATAPAWEVIDHNGASRFVGTYDMCQDFLRPY